MFTLKLYRNGPLEGGRTVILEVTGIWCDHLSDGVKYIQAFKKKVGVMDEDGGHEFYVGGNWTPPPAYNPSEPLPAINTDTYYGWGVLENALGKTTEMFR